MEETDIGQHVVNVSKQADISPMDKSRNTRKGRKAKNSGEAKTIKTMSKRSTAASKNLEEIPPSRILPKRNDRGKVIITTLVYAKCDAAERLLLWDNTYSLSSNMTFPWLIGGDFNVIMNEEEKIGGLPVYPNEYEDFAFCMISCELNEVEFRGSPFTWCNGRDWFRTLSMEHFSRTGSNHAPLLLLAGEQVQPFHKHFRFLKFWLGQDSFMQVVEDFWKIDYLGDPFVTFKLKMKKLTIREDIAKIKEQLFEEFSSEGNRMARRKRLHLSRIQNAEGEWKEDDDQIAEAAIDFYQSQFTEEETSQDCRLLDVISPKVTQEQNSLLSAMPTLEEVKKVVFALSGDSACGPDGFSGIFYQKCWNIVGADVYNVVKAFYEGQTLPKYVIHINLVLLPKKSFINTFSDLRPISLSNFINKVISRVIHDKLESVLPTLFSANQSGFLKRRNIIVNVLLT
ncbi:uncharacterized protein LOC132601548 [Lycium barbarum]|uniref:uncharacterized protein LOC132601548 n=1 Tax=Lycium barbarum TaxID=112863 RepID=UPI00293EA2E5|nr:uncharacterized protein LOC132601548 [Lycium barbarum]